MPNFYINDKPVHSQFKDWEKSSKFNSKARIVDETGKKVNSSYTGRCYLLFDKRKRDFSPTERVVKFLLGSMALFASLGFAWRSKSVRQLFKNKESVRFGVEIKLNARQMDILHQICLHLSQSKLKHPCIAVNHQNKRKKEDCNEAVQLLFKYKLIPARSYFKENSDRLFTLKEAYYDPDPVIFCHQFKASMPSYLIKLEGFDITKIIKDILNHPNYYDYRFSFPSEIIFRQFVQDIAIAILVTTFPGKKVREVIAECVKLHPHLDQKALLNTFDICKQNTHQLLSKQSSSSILDTRLLYWLVGCQPAYSPEEEAAFSSIQTLRKALFLPIQSTQTSQTLKSNQRAIKS